MEFASLGHMLLLSALIGTSAVVLLTASLNDVALRTMPNWSSLALAPIGIALRLLDTSLCYGLAAACAVFFVTYVCWRRRWIGGGDVKLLTACALLVPPGDVLSLVLLTTLCGGILAVFYLSLAILLRLRPLIAGRPAAPRSMARDRHVGLSGFLFRLWRVECRRILRRAPLPYGCAITGAALILMLGPTGPLGK